jgi:3-oxoacyl-[acyl-carrier protein] reductase
LRFPESTDEDWYDAFDPLLMAPVRLVRSASEHLAQDGGGTIVAITSRAVKEANPSNVLSSSVRMGVVGLTKTLSKELAPEVRVNAVLPSTIDSPRVWNGLEAAVERGDYDTYDEALAGRTDPVPLDRLGDVSELGDAVTFLCSDRAGYINGTALAIDGGCSHSTL